MYRAILLAFAALFAFVSCGPSYEDAMKHDPEPFRAQIEEVETLLQKPESELGDGSKLHITCANLAGALGRTIDNHTHKEFVMNRLVSYGAVYAQQEEANLPWDIAEAREAWKNVRADLFLDADWFK